ncbi:uncharacterized protein LOC115634082 [Scaptodrosophila lebanonensis]|uniref:Uncharacterized protein LOC115634082 n=1 Tax=Drosophila lebanonensis TaxID=7225 RepID=A0A6J2UH93_DROLE|nr:uncharacterized protein LOC115634082 [Scaptodrosophila lebanonensis]
MPSDAKFSIFDVEQPKPHIVHVVYDQADLSASQKKRKAKKSPRTKNVEKISTRTAEKVDADKKGREINIKMLDCSIITAVASEQKAEVFDLIQEPLTAPIDVVKSPKFRKEIAQPLFTDTIGYLTYHHERLKRILANQGHSTSIGMSLQKSSLMSTEIEMNMPQFDDPHFKNLEAVAILAQNRFMRNTSSATS